LEALADDSTDSTPAAKVTSNISKQLQSGDMVRVRAVNDAMNDKDMEFWDKLAYVKQAVNLYSASTMDESEAKAEYDDKGQKIPF